MWPGTGNGMLLVTKYDLLWHGSLRYGTVSADSEGKHFKALWLGIGNGMFVVTKYHMYIAPVVHKLLVGDHIFRTEVCRTQWFQG